MPSEFESVMGELNSGVFWPEFTFVESQFVPEPGCTGELADNLIWYDDRVFIVQMKVREKPTADPDKERTWFKKKILGTATKQIRDSLGYLEAHERIAVTNLLGHKWQINKSEISHITKIILYESAKNLPYDCRELRYHVSKSAGFIHVIHVQDYLEVLKYFGIPEDLRQYLVYRENVVPEFRAAGIYIDEVDIIGAFIRDDRQPSAGSREVLTRMPIELPLLEFQCILTNLRENIHNAADPRSYYKVLQTFARAPRSVWREVNTQFLLALEAAENERFFRPTRVIDPHLDVSFMVAALDPALPKIGKESEDFRMRSLTNLTYTAMYLAQTAQGIGIFLSADGEWRNVDWCFLDMPWEHDPEIEARIADGMPFAEVKEVTRPRFYIISDMK